jgi:hypothetical protein
LFLVLLLGLVLRGHELGSESLWVDEGYTVKTALRTPAETLRTIGHSINAPVYPLLMHQWIRWFGASETALRFPSVVLSLLTILMVHRLGRLLFDEATGLLAATIVALSVFHVSYAREARSYALMVLLSTASYYFFAAWPIHRRRRDLVGYVLATTILLYTHSFAVLVVLTQNLYVLAASMWSRLQPAWRAREWLAMQAGVGVLYAVWALIMLQHLSIVSAGFWIPPPSWSRLRYLAGLYGPRWAWAVFGVVLVSQSSRLFAASRDLSRCSGSGSTTVALPTVASFYFVPMLEPRYIIAGTVPHILGAAATVRVWPSWLRVAASGSFSRRSPRRRLRGTPRTTKGLAQRPIPPARNRATSSSSPAVEPVRAGLLPLGAKRFRSGISRWAFDGRWSVSNRAAMSHPRAEELEDLPKRYQRIWVVVANAGIQKGHANSASGTARGAPRFWLDVFQLERSF